MRTILNPILLDGSSKVKCIHYYERTIGTKTDQWQAIFVWDGKIYLKITNSPYNFNGKRLDVLEDFGECEPLNMEKALKAFKEYII